MYRAFGLYTYATIDRRLVASGVVPATRAASLIATGRHKRRLRKKPDVLSQIPRECFRLWDVDQRRPARDPAIPEAQILPHLVPLPPAGYLEAALLAFEPKFERDGLSKSKMRTMKALDVEAARAAIEGRTAITSLNKLKRERKRDIPTKPEDGASDPEDARSVQVQVARASSDTEVSSYLNDVFSCRC
ncbi:hypothetical protein HYDPIDRAFT_116762 [Hydnomerulius pinastri MD-312]|uniref:Uncharacterized protein n=1 Tax=Hydnomerulius pinastri MD-312 TaxID=994086 RepID=A0A0C9WBE1_9AGAM|nr:hypothetical protein HYDPIDRAFT_116762 [Hydnomerulius pinastri MD-312]